MFFQIFLLIMCLNLPGNVHNRHHNIICLPDRLEQIQTIGKIEIKVCGTFYCNCPICCGEWSKHNLTASGTTPIEGKTIAVDPNIIPLGSQIIFIEVPDGLEYLKFNPDGTRKIFYAEDTGNKDYVAGNRIDIFINDHNLAVQLGIKDFTIKIIPPQ